MVPLQWSDACLTGASYPMKLTTIIGTFRGFFKKVRALTVGIWWRIPFRTGLWLTTRGQILCATSKLRGVGLVCRSNPSVAYFLPIKASALLLVSRWRIGDFVRAYVIAGALRTRVAVQVGRESHADCGRVNACVDGR